MSTPDENSLIYDWAAAGSRRAGWPAHVMLDDETLRDGLQSPSVIDPAVGIVFEKKVGDPVSAGERICVLYANDRARLAPAREKLNRAIAVSAEPVEVKKLILAQVP